MNLRRLQFAYWIRLAYPFATIALLSLALALFRIARRRWVLLLTVFLAAFGHYTLGYEGREILLNTSVPVIVAAWLPNIVLISVAGAVMRMSHPLQESRER